MLIGVVAYPFALAVAALVAWRAARRGQPAFVVCMRVLFVLYIGWVIGATLFPLPIRAEVVRLEAAGRGVTVGLTPCASIRDVLANGTFFVQLWIIGGNILTLTPFGFLLPFMAPRLARWPRILLAGLCFSLAIELGQLAVSLVLGYSYRVTEVDDVILNVAGVLLGYAAFGVLRHRVAEPRLPAPRKTRGEGSVYT